MTLLSGHGLREAADCAAGAALKAASEFGMVPAAPWIFFPICWAKIVGPNYGKDVEEHIYGCQTVLYIFSMTMARRCEEMECLWRANLRTCFFEVLSCLDFESPKRTQL